MQNSCQYANGCERIQRDESRDSSRHFSQEQEGHHDEGPLRKRARIGDYAGPSTTSQHTGHAVNNSVARDYARVQYGDIHNVYHGTTSTAAPAPASSDDLLNSLSFIQMDVRQENIARAYSTTCQWLYDRPEYKAWRNPHQRIDHQGFFWIKSKPGAGKSTLMKFLLNSAKQHLPQDNIISFFFNARGDQLEQSIEGMYRHLLYQLLKTIPRLQYVLQLPNAYDAFQHGWPVDKLKSLFREAVLSMEKDRLTCFIDALDECPEDQVRDLIEYLEDLGESLDSGEISLHICFSSRHYPNVNIAKCQHLTLDGQEGHQQDIASYIKRKLHGRGKKIETAEFAIREKAHGVFLWAVLVVQILNKEIDRGNVHNLQRRLEEIPAGLHELFQDILGRGIEDDEHLVPILRWIMYAKRPLSREELYFAIHSGAQHSIALKPWDSDEIDLKSMDLFILNCSKGLAEMTRGKKPTVQFIHESVRDYLRESGLQKLQSSPRAASDGLSHDYLKQCCWNLMTQKVLEHLTLPTPLPKAKSDEAKRLRERASRFYPFLEYANSYMTHHAELASSHGICQAVFVKSFPARTWIKIHDNFAVHGTRRLGHSMATGPDVFVQQRNWHLFELSIRLENSPVNSDQGESALSAAPNSDTAGLLMHLFEELVSPATYYRRTLELAMDSQSLAALRVTLKRMPKAVLASHSVATLRHSSALGDSDILRTLIDHGLYISDVTELGKSFILEPAISNGHEAFVKLLLEHFRTIDDTTLTSAFRQALGEENMSIARTLLQHADSKGVGISSSSRVLCNALHEASGDGNFRLVQLLLQIGADPSFGLVQASRAGHEAVVRLLLESDINADFSSTTGRRALHEASSAGREAVVRLLLEKGVDVNPVYLLRRSALHEASIAGHEAVVRLLLEKGADANHVCSLQRSALNEASKNGHEGIVRLLLTNGADVNHASFTGRSALHEASQAGQEPVVRALLEHGADLSLLTDKGRTSLDEAHSNGYVSIVALLDEWHRRQVASRPLVRSTSGDGGESTAPLLHESEPEIDN